MGNGKAEVPMLDVGGVGEVYGGTFPARTWHDFMSNALANLPAVPFTPPNFALLPAPHYITSASLVAADVLDHNSVAGCSGYSSYNYNSYCSTGQTGTGPNNGSGNRYRYGYSPPVTTRSYAPRATQPPVTQPPAAPPPTTKKPTKKSRHP